MAAVEHLVLTGWSVVLRWQEAAICRRHKIRKQCVMVIAHQ